MTDTPKPTSLIHCPNCGTIYHKTYSACPKCSAAMTDDERVREEFDQPAELLYDLFRTAPIPTKVNGQDGRAAFFSKEAQIAQAKLILQAAYAAGRDSGAEREKELRDLLIKAAGYLPSAEDSSVYRVQQKLVAEVERALGKERT